MGLRNFFDRIEPNFVNGGKYEKYFPIYEMIETILYTGKQVTKAAPHARSRARCTRRCRGARRHPRHGGAGSRHRGRPCA